MDQRLEEAWRRTRRLERALARFLPEELPPRARLHDGRCRPLVPPIARPFEFERPPTVRCHLVRVIRKAGQRIEVVATLGLVLGLVGGASAAPVLCARLPDGSRYCQEGADVERLFEHERQAEQERAETRHEWQRELQRDQDQSHEEFQRDLERLQECVDGIGAGCR